MKFSLAAARNAIQVGDFQTALLHFYPILHWISSVERRKYLKEFGDTLRGFLCDERNDDESKLAMLAMSRELFADEPLLLNIAAEFLFRSGRYLEAFDLARRASASENREERLHALVNRENIKSNIMDQWHWAMLNDASRNGAYENAMRLALGERLGARVLDIGAGTAFLSLIARRFSPKVYCCEVDERISQLAERIAIGSGVHIIHKHSTDVSTEDLDSQKVDVIITETMDSGLLGEGIILALLDAHRRLLSSESSIIIPNSLVQATVYACLIECQAITDEHVAVVKGRRFVSPYVLIGSEARLTKGCEPYWCCYANELKGGFRYLSGSVPVFNVNFEDASRLENISNGVHEEHAVELHQQGRVHAIMVWFRCSLFPGLPALSSSVEANNCWQQAIYPVEEPFAVVPGDHCILAVDAYRDRLFCEILRYSFGAENTWMDEEVDSLPLEKMRFDSASRSLKGNAENSTHEHAQCSHEQSGQNGKRSLDDRDKRADSFGSYVLVTGDSSADVEMEEVDEPTEGGRENEIMETANILHETDFLFLNDSALVSFFARCLSALVQPGTTFERGDVSLVDITGVASVSGSLASYNENYYCLCYYRSDDYRMLIEAFQTTGRCVLRAFDGSQGFPCAGDVLFCWPITSSGTLCEHSLSRIVEWKLRNPSGIVIPSCVRIRAQLLSCLKIVRRSKPQRSAHQGVDLSAIDELALTYYYDIEPSTLSYEKLSEPFDLLTLRFDSELPSEAGVLPNFLQQLDTRSQVLTCSSGLADGLLYWFELTYGNEKYSTQSDETAARCAMYLFDESRAVNRGDRVAFMCSLFHANLIVELER
ncbi:Arginine N-methyltransferase [Toxocara canis]|uniref:Arginine N-methyltransferase n=1 Tax=Toxocara canis TaxID=6265 RepID=A0A0B2V3U6_TOXCA|nr:Arginine N-methyltransferase [Toxocara canis]